MPISTNSQGPAENRLLASLPDEVLDRLLPHLQPVSFALGGVVYESNERMEGLYFPTTCVVSLLYTMTTMRPPRLAWLVTMASLASPSLWAATQA